MRKDIRRQVCRANKRMGDETCLTFLRFGNVSEVDRAAGVVVIKPSGVAFEELKQKDMVAVSLETGEVVSGELNPSVDTATHIGLYNAFPDIGGICHTHSINATMYAQACCPIPCLGTTHADSFYGDIPVTRLLLPEEVREDYEGSTARVIIECFEYNHLNPVEVPGVIVAHHGPFTFGKSAHEAVESSIILEACARMAVGTQFINPHVQSLPQHVLDHHYFRKHGPDASYGQE